MHKSRLSRSGINNLNSGDGQGVFLWIVWLVIDFPVSLIVIFSFFTDSYSLDLMYFTHGVLGTVLWYFIGSYNPKNRKWGGSSGT